MNSFQQLNNKWIDEKEWICLRLNVNCQLIKVERVLKLENQHFAIILEKIGSDKTYE